MTLLINNLAFIEMVSGSWHWSVSGAAIASIVFLLTWMGRSFGVSTTFENFCSLAGAGNHLDFFKVDMKEQYWRFAFVGGAILGGFLATYVLVNPDVVDISASTIAHLQQDFGMSYPQGRGFLPTEIFNFTNPKGIILSIIGGFLIGFGARYGKGCTSGHAITGLSHLQLPSLITVIGFFIGGLTMTWLIMPLIF